MIYTFWEGPMPEYIKLCLETWQQPFKLLHYDNLHEYTDLKVEPLKRFTLPQIADCVRVHVLRDQGGYWLDADTIMLTGELPDTDMVGDPGKRTNSIGLLYSEPQSEMFTAWAKYQDEIISGPGTSLLWSLMGNSFTDPYVREHEEVRIHPIDWYWPETYMIPGEASRAEKYVRFYFVGRYHLSDIKDTDLLMLHNSWTPDWFKRRGWIDTMYGMCTMSNILREVHGR